MVVRLSPVEAVALHVLRSACRRVTVRLVAGLLALMLLYWGYLRIVGGGDPGGTTLYNPDRLREALEQFTAPGSAGDATGRDRRHRTESLCRRLLEWMLRTELPKCRPAWLVNPTGARPLFLLGAVRHRRADASNWTCTARHATSPLNTTARSTTSSPPIFTSTSTTLPTVSCWTV